MATSSRSTVDSWFEGVASMGARMGALIPILFAVLDPGAVLPFAHETGFPHEEPARSGGGTGVVVIVGSFS
jgi:hypothetical protein